MSIKMRLQTLIIEKKPANEHDIDWHNYISHDEVVELLAKTNHPDKLVLVPQEGKYGVEDIDELISWQQLKPFNSTHKVTIIEQADLLNIESQNRLLKTLEEPYENSQIILIVANQHKLLDTVLSRSLIYKDLTANEESSSHLVNDFITGNLITRFKLAEEIAALDENKDIGANILSAIFQRLNSGQLDINYQDLLQIYIGFRKNKYNLRLTLECLAIMLE